MQPTAQNKSFEIPQTMPAWILGGPQELSLTEKPVPQPGPAEVLVRFDATIIHTHTFPFKDLPTAIKYQRERIEDAIKVVVKMKDE